MSIRKKTFILVIITLCSLLLLVYFLGKNIIIENVLNVEEKQLKTNIVRVQNFLNNKLKHIQDITNDWAYWDYSYNFMKNVNENYIKTNLGNETFEELNLNLIAYFDLEKKPVFLKGYDLEKKQEEEISSQLVTTILNEYSILFESCTNGIILLPDGPMLISSSSILTSERNGPSPGTLIMGRYLTKKELNLIAKQMNLQVDILNINELDENSESLINKDGVLIKRLNDSLIEGYVELKDINLKPVFFLKVSTERDFFISGKNSIIYFAWALLVAGVIFGLIVIVSLEKMVVSRLFTLSSKINDISSTCDFSKKISIPGNDELNKLIDNINDMLNTLALSQKKLMKKEKKYRNLSRILDLLYKQLKDVIEFFPDPILIFTNEEVLAWNKAMEELTGIPKEEILQKENYQKYKDLLDKFDIVNNPEAFENIEKKENIYYGETYLKELKGGKGAYLWIKASSLFTKEGTSIGIIESIRDITERKMTEDRLRYLSLYDSLTGVYNRTYFEEMMEKLKKETYDKIGIIVCDVDGLKLVNDTLGHTKGDKLLRQTANILIRNVENGDIIARIGGDEFAILKINSNKNDLEDTTLKIMNDIKVHNSNNPGLPISISLGYAYSGGKTDIDRLFKEADNFMYKEKLYHKSSNRSTIVKALMKALAARDFITQGHGERLQKIVEKIALEINYPKNKITELKLFAQFHDIGKVAISDRILFKKGPLTYEERKEMELHTEIGYRIAESVPDLQSISDWILKHHEWWNGKGYPLGLKGEEIPLECRMLAIADAYDAMTNDRPYRKALSQREAINEIKKNAGIQFDPELVNSFIKIFETLQSA